MFSIIFLSRCSEVPEFGTRKSVVWTCNAAAYDANTLRMMMFMSAKPRVLGPRSRAAARPRRSEQLEDTAAHYSLRGGSEVPGYRGQFYSISDTKEN